MSCRGGAKCIVLLAVLHTMSPPALCQAAGPPAAAQTPSPMVESTRAHERLTQRPFAGAVRSFTGPAGKAVEVFIPDRALRGGAIDVVIHFHGAS